MISVSEKVQSKQTKNRKRYRHREIPKVIHYVNNRNRVL